LAAVAALCLGSAFAPQALAQNCGGAISLVANQWRMVAVSCAPNSSATVSSMFGPSLGAANYNVTWVVWKRVYNNTTLCPTAARNDCYTKLALTSPVTTGDAFWIYTTNAVSLQYPNSTPATPGTYFEFPAQLSDDSTSRYYMFGNPYPTTKNWADFQWPVLLFGFIPYTGTTQQAIDNYGASKNIYYWNGTNTYYTRDNTSSPNPAATFAAKEAAWIEFQNPADTISNVRVRVPGP
jgi:hypothetical protein